MGPMPFCIGEPVGIHYKGFAVVLGDHVEDDAGDDEQEAYDDEHDGTDQRGEVDDHAGAYEFGGDPSTQHDADDADDQPRVPKNGSGLYSRIMRKMVLITLMPSPTVSSLLTEPSGRSRY